MAAKAKKPRTKAGITRHYASRTSSPSTTSTDESDYQSTSIAHLRSRTKPQTSTVARGSRGRPNTKPKPQSKSKSKIAKHDNLPLTDRQPIFPNLRTATLSKASTRTTVDPAVSSVVTTETVVFPLCTSTKAFRALATSRGDTALETLKTSRNEVLKNHYLKRETVSAALIAVEKSLSYSSGIPDGDSQEGAVQTLAEALSASLQDARTLLAGYESLIHAEALASTNNGNLAGDIASGEGESEAADSTILQEGRNRILAVDSSLCAGLEKWFTGVVVSDDGVEMSEVHDALGDFMPAGLSWAESERVLGKAVRRLGRIAIWEVSS